MILNADGRDLWLSGEDETDLGAGVQLRQHEVARFGIQDDGEQLIEAIG